MVIKMKKINQLRLVLLIMLMGLVSFAHAGNKASLKGVDSRLLPSGQVELQLHFDHEPPAPTAFVWKDPSRTVFDFHNVMQSMAMRSKNINQSNISKLVIQEAGNKLRVLVHQTQFSGYATEISGSNLIIRFDKPANRDRASYNKAKQQNVDLATKSAIPELESPVWNKIPEPQTKPKIRANKAIVPKAKSTTYKKKANNHVNKSRNLRKVDFRREVDGSGKVTLTLPAYDTKVEEHRTGSTIRLLIKDVDVPQHLQKRLDVLDFATPVTYIETSQRQLGTKVVIYAKGNIEYKVKRDGRNYSIVIAKKKKDDRLKKKKKTFKGDKLSLNFQDIEVRAVLQLLADFTDKNIVVSDTVEGSITVRLKDIPWDQALDIVLETKNLAMRENGRVIWVAPASELAAK